MAEQRSRSASIAMRISSFGALSALGGLAGVHSGLIPPMVGFLLFVLGTLPCGLAGAIASAVALVKTHRGAGPRDRRTARLATGVAAGLISLFALAALRSGEAPPINDITTDLADPPAFASAANVGAYAGRDMRYPADFAAVVRSAYPDLAPLRLHLPPDEAYVRALQAARDLGWAIRHRDPGAGTFDATDTTRIFRFVDDIAVRVRAEGDGARVDLRSKSRDGRGDLGANAARIRAFEAQLRQVVESDWP